MKRRITAALLCLAVLTASAAPCFPRRIWAPAYAAEYAGEVLTEEEQEYIVNVLMEWIRRQMGNPS